MKFAAIADTLLDETNTQACLQDALEEFLRQCSAASGVVPNRSFDAWAEDSFLESGVAINSQAAAHCVTDYRRTVVFIRGVCAALTQALQQFPDTPVRVLYAGCGPYATLLLPLLSRFDPARLDITLLDYHQPSLDGVTCLIECFDYEGYCIKLQRADACTYQHPEPLHLIIAETMQKSLEQEPQFAVTANLAPQLCAGGFFIPQKIEVELCLAKLVQEQALFRRDGVVDGQSLTASGGRIPLATVLTLLPQQAAALKETAVHNQLSGNMELPPTLIDIPRTLEEDDFDALLFTRIQVFSHHHLADYEAEITLPLHCPELAAARAGERCKVCYQLGSYPKFDVTKV